MSRSLILFKTGAMLKQKRFKCINIFSGNQSTNPSENIFKLQCNSNIHIGISLTVHFCFELYISLQKGTMISK